MESSGQQVNNVPVPFYFPLDDLVHEYVSGDATKSSRACLVKNYCQGALCVAIVSTGTPTDITFDLEFSRDDLTYYKKADTYWANFVFDDTVLADGVARRYSFDLRDATGWVRITATATGTGASGVTSFEITEAYFEMKSR